MLSTGPSRPLPENNHLQASLFHGREQRGDPLIVFSFQSFFQSILFIFRADVLSKAMIMVNLR